MSEQSAFVPQPAPQGLEDRTGRVYGNYTILRFSRRVGYRYFWLARCSCGQVSEVATTNLGRTTYCKACRPYGKDCQQRPATAARIEARQVRLKAARRQQRAVRICNRLQRFCPGRVPPEWQTPEGLIAALGEVFPDSQLRVPASGPLTVQTVRLIRRPGRVPTMVLEPVPGQTASELAETLGMTKAAVYLRIQRAREKPELATAIARAAGISITPTHALTRPPQARGLFRKRALWASQFPGIPERLAAGELMLLELDSATWREDIRHLELLTGAPLTYRHLQGAGKEHCLLRLQNLSDMQPPPAPPDIDIAFQVPT
jgi:hypothetical protein